MFISFFSPLTHMKHGQKLPNYEYAEGFLVISGCASTLGVEVKLYWNEIQYNYPVRVITSTQVEAEISICYCAGNYKVKKESVFYKMK